MQQVYSDPNCEDDQHSLPDVEIFYRTLVENTEDEWVGETRSAAHREDDDEVWGEGWYWWTCFPGCLPDSQPFGPFTTAEEALVNVREDN